MNRFIEVHRNGKPYLINTRWIEGITDNTIYLAFTAPQDTVQDHIKTDETYEQLKELIWEVNHEPT